MSVSMMRVRIVRMAVQQRCVMVRMGMARARRYRRLVGVVVVRVARAMHVLMLVIQRFVRMRVFVVLAQVQPDPACHQRGSQPELDRHRIAEQPHL